MYEATNVRLHPAIAAADKKSREAVHVYRAFR